MKSAAIIVLFMLLWNAQQARAANCNLSGRISIESLDSYYCDETPLPLGSTYCNAWIEKNLDSTTRPMGYITLNVLNSGNVISGSGVTNSQGDYTINFTQPVTCNGNVSLLITFTRVHEADLLVTGRRQRFQITDNSNFPYLVAVQTPPLAGTNTVFNHTFKRPVAPPGGVLPDPDLITKVANVYYTTNSALTEIITWRPKISTAFDGVSKGPLPVKYVPSSMLGNSSTVWSIQLNGGMYNQGFGVRHELGHLVSVALYDFEQGGQCFSYAFGAEVPGHGLMTCEWGYVAMNESLASFFGVRSITTSDKNAWACGGNNNANQSACMGLALSANTLMDFDRILLDGTVFIGVGDTFATTSNHCARPPTGFAGGCQTCTNFNPCVSCPDVTREVVGGPPVAGSDGICDDFKTWGARLEPDIVRFLWDMVDTNNEGDEATDESVVTLTAKMETMACDTSASYGADGSCNEPHRLNGTQCVPVSPVPDRQDLAIGNAVTPMRGTRDAFNPWDFGDLIPGSQATARSINCVNLASD